MKSPAQNIRIATYDDLFKTDAERQADTQERVQILPLDKLTPFPNHPFKVLDDEKMQDTVESVKEHGVLVPLLVRPKDDGTFEIVSGHRRHHASMLAGKMEIPAIVREMDDDTATIIMVDSNLQRETILPSEKAFAYKMKLDAMKRQAGRPSKENSVQVGQNLRGTVSRDMLAENSPDSSVQIQRYIRLTNLSPRLLDMVDNKTMAFNAAVEVSYSHLKTLLKQAGLPNIRFHDLRHPNVKLSTKNIVGETPQGYINSERRKSQVIFLDENLRRNKQRKSWIQQPQKPLTDANAKLNYLMQNPSEIIDFRGVLVRVVRLERTVSWSQTRRDTNFAIPGYLLVRFLEILLSVVKAVVRCNFEVLFIR